MDVNNEDLSLSLYRYLCKMIGSEDVVRTRRRLFNAHDCAGAGRVKCIISGSKGEGIDLGGSDTDIMYVGNRISVYENIEDISIHKHNRPMKKLPLIMDTNDTKPGYTLLKLYDKNGIDLSICYEIGKHTFLSSKLFRGRKISDEYTFHGPCLSNPITRHDSVEALHCEKWILQADEWIHRSRSSWPHNRLIQRIMKFGVLFVPVGCKNSPREDLEFRISFNIAEKLLVHSFSHVQLLCYTLLKTILSDFIKPQYGDLLCSYFLKTIMFWVSEESMESTWKPQNLLRCYDLCLKRLVYCVTYNTCLHYFIRKLDLFEGRFSKSEQISLTRTLENLYKGSLQCVLQTSFFSSLNYLNDISPVIIEQSVSALSSVCLTGFMDVLNSANLLRLIIIVYGSLSLREKEMYAIILSQKIQKAAQCIPIDITFNDTNKKRYRNYRNCLNHLLQGINHDAVSGWLLLASFLYTYKQYQQCLYVLNYCLHQCTPDKILLVINIDTKLQHEFNIDMQQHVKNGFQRTCKLRVVDIVKFQKHSCIIPEELSIFVVDTCIIFPPIVFAHFLRCISLHRLDRNKRDTMNAFRDLETTVQDMYFISENDYQIENSYKCIAVARHLLAG